MKPVARRALPKWLLLLSLVVFLGAKTSEREKRVALVIGNGAYQRMTRLTNPPQDARDVGRKLESLGFEVTELENQGRAAMEMAVEAFAKRSQGAKVAVLYYSGHGIQIDGWNYLIPVDAEPPDDEAGMHRQAVELEWLVGRTTRAAQVSVIFMDACRNNPGLDQKLPGSGKDGTRDVRLVTIPKGTVQVLYAASKGQRALDGVGSADKKSRNSPFAEALLEHLGDRDAVQVVAARIIGQVKNRTKNQQQPEQQGNLDELLYLAGRSAPVTCPAGTVLTDGACQPVVYKTCPTGLRFEEAVGCVPNVVATPVEAKPKVESLTAAPVVGTSPQRDSSVPIPVAPGVGTATADRSQPILNETDQRPKMVSIPSGRFVMGSPSGVGDADEHPQHEVELTRSFWISEVEVTQGQYLAVMGSNPSDFQSGLGARRRPAESVSWDDAVTYCNQLSQREGLEPCYQVTNSGVSWPKGPGCGGYRLPTEAEWEYAARAGGATDYSGGHDAAEVAWFSDNAEGTTHEGGKRKANGWGLYDMSGNVWEWVWDAYAPYKPDPQKDPFGPLEGGYQRVRRSGSWGSDAWSVRVANRSWDGPSSRNLYVGFRLARSCTSNMVTGTSAASTPPLSAPRTAGAEPSTPPVHTITVGGITVPIVDIPSVYRVQQDQAVGRLGQIAESLDRVDLSACKAKGGSGTLKAKLTIAADGKVLRVAEEYASLPAAGRACVFGTIARHQLPSGPAPTITITHVFRVR